MGRLFFILFIVSSLLACNRTVSDDTHLSTNTSREEIEDSLSQRIIELTDSIHCLNDSINKCLKQVKLSTPNVEVNLLLDSIDKAHKTELNIYIDSISRIEAQNDSISSVLAESGMAEHTWQQKVSQHIICIIILILLLLIVAGRFILRKILKYVSRKKEKKVKQEESGSEKSTDDTLSNEENENLMTHDSVSSVNEYPDSLQLLQTIQENQEKLLEKLENLPVEKQQEEKGKDCKNQEERIHSVVNQVIDRAKGEISKTLKKAIEEKQEQFRLEFEEKKNELKKEAEEKIARQKAKEIEDIRTNLELKQKECDKAVRELNSTKQELRGKEDELIRKKAEVSRLNEAQKTFTSQLTSVAFAQPYSKQIEKLVGVVNQIVTKGLSLLKYNLEDPYHLLKALTRFTKQLYEIDASAFTLDMAMAAKSHFAFKDSPIASFNQDENDDKLQLAVKQYYFEKYLKTYIDAAVVLNETLAGLHYIIKDLDASKCEVFDELRKDLERECDALGIQVTSVKLFEYVGQKIDLVVEPIDVEIGSTGQILEINNCQVALKGTNAQTDKISVKIKK